MTPWIDIYKDRLNNSYYDYFCKQYSPFLETIFKYQTPVVFELGCGMGNSTRFLNEQFNTSQHFCHDICPEMLALAMKNIESTNVFYRNIDIRKVRNFDNPKSLIHSHGVLEHFSDKDIYNILENFNGDIQVHYVPSDKWIIPSRGDERLLSKEYWDSKFCPSEIIEFNEGKDLILIWK